ncbi:hypothetical protein ILUMI_27495 [Ignelater luminosus]|uniref:Transposase Tc1-like domain-containing protein n=1 Tax=Ignelater luminosus TaxID=2038154 RepID=A0A8K0C4W8_IGNLU|nr:hypothetical protein ILUMI_27495 [Ignelater luminosus]
MRTQKITSALDDRYLKRLCTANRFKTSRELNCEFSQYTKQKISARTVRRRLLSAGLAARRPRKKPILNNKMRIKRLKWARNWTEKEWNRVIFSNEKKFNLNALDGLGYVRRRPGEEFKSYTTIKTTKFPAGLMVWGCFLRVELAGWKLLKEM